MRYTQLKNEQETDIGFAIGITILLIFTFFFINFGLPYLNKTLKLPQSQTTLSTKTQN